MTKAPTPNTSSSRTASPSLTSVAIITLTVVVTLGTLYSLVYGTALDTSNPAFHDTIRPDGQTRYFAQKSNVFNVYFVKKAWGWTSVAFFGIFLTSPPSIHRPTRRAA